MKGDLDLTGEQRAMLLDLLGKHLSGMKVWAYGSRVKGTARPYSDLDLVVFASTAETGRVPELREALEESNLPFPVDLHVWRELPGSFHERIREGYAVLQEGCSVETPGTAGHGP